MFSWILRLSFLLSIALSLSPNSPVSGTTTTMSSTSNDDVVDEESSRETLKPWSDRWKKRRIGFHLKDANPALVKHAASLLPDTKDDETCGNKDATTRIFVPLCGKAIDMAYLVTSLSSSSSQKIQVVGLEGIRIALEQFIEEQPDLNISKEALPATEQVPFERFVGETVSLWKGVLEYSALTELITHLTQLIQMM